jgi:hypothetical protein
MIEAGEAAGASRGRAREAIEYFLWAFTPLRPMTARDIYELVSTNAFTTRGLYLNLGYWKNARTIDEACQALAELVGSTAAMGPGDDIVDVGFGFAAQDVFWMERFAPRRITGLNVTPLQVRTARERVRALGMARGLSHRNAAAECFMRCRDRRRVRLPFQHPRAFPRRGIPRASPRWAPCAG